MDDYVSLQMLIFVQIMYYCMVCMVYPIYNLPSTDWRTGQWVECGGSFTDANDLSCNKEHRHTGAY